jgi:N-acetyl-gamma-glutamylphosphate reductase
MSSQPAQASAPLKVGVVGGTGYTGVELLRLLVNHPHAELDVITSRGEAGVEDELIWSSVSRTQSGWQAVTWCSLLHPIM